MALTLVKRTCAAPMPPRSLIVGQCPICGYFVGASTRETAEVKLHAHLAVKHPQARTPKEIA